MDSILTFLKDYGTQLSSLVAAIVFVFGVIKFQIERRTNMFWKEFEVYHKLVKELVEPPSEDGALYVDQQGAIIFEMRNFKRYFPYTLRMLKDLKKNGTMLQVNSHA